MLKTYLKTQIKPYMIRSFLFGDPEGPYAVLCAITVMSPADLHSLNIYMVCGPMRISFVI